MARTIVVVEDDRQIRKVVEGYLQQAGYRVLSSGDGANGLWIIQQEKPFLVVLDLMLPELDGWDITRRLRNSSDPALSSIYIIMLTARVEEADRVVGLELGADDYIAKPFSPRELVARVRSATRRISQQEQSTSAQVLQSDDLRLDPTYRVATVGDSPIDLTTTEFDLLHHLMLHPGRPFSRDELLDVTQPNALGDTAAYERTIDVHIKNLRQKLGDSGRDSRFIETVQRVGYRFVPQLTTYSGSVEG